VCPFASTIGVVSLTIARWPLCCGDNTVAVATYTTRWDATRALAWQRRATGVAAEANRPGYVLKVLGLVPASTRGRRAWRQAAAEIEQYRNTYGISDPMRALGPVPHDRAQRADRQRARTAIERVQAKQRAADRTHQRQPTSERTIQPRPHQQRDRPGPERAAG
jgi:hypothetical protein